MSFEDKELTCAECGNSFTFTAQEQELYQNRGYQNEPKRCANCREQRRQKFGRGGPGRGGRGFGGGGRGGPRQTFTATCSKCGNEAQLPFKPRGDRPVYCRNCFQK